MGVVGIATICSAILLVVTYLVAVICLPDNEP
jgi:phage shock protein PspC (stress-responsive transcriptional regulator)